MPGIEHQRFEDAEDAMSGFLPDLLYAALAAAVAVFIIWPNRLTSKIVSAVVVNRPIETVFDYVTTPANWPDWHPASRGVSGATDHSLDVGEEVGESFVAAGRPGDCVWKVTRREPPNLWAITTRVGDMGADITYRLTAEAGATRFERTMDYWTSGVMLGLLDIAVMRRRNRAESEQALLQLKARLEALPAEAES